MPILLPDGQPIGFSLEISNAVLSLFAAACSGVQPSSEAAADGFIVMPSGILTVIE